MNRDEARSPNYPRFVILYSSSWQERQLVKIIIGRNKIPGPLSSNAHSLFFKCCRRSNCRVPRMLDLVALPITMPIISRLILIFMTH